MLKKIFLLIFLSFVFYYGHHFFPRTPRDPSTPSEGYKVVIRQLKNRSIRPLLVLVQSNPWKYIETKSPCFALYDNGLLIYQMTHIYKLDGMHIEDDQHIPHSFKYFQLSQKMIKQFMASLPTKEFFKLDDYYDLKPEATDQGYTIIYMWDSKNNNIRRVAIRGYRQQKNLSAFLEIYKKLTHIENLEKIAKAKQKKWIPKNIEILFTDFSHSRQSPIHWPKHWKIKKVSNDKILLDSSFYNAFLNLHQKLQRSQGFLLDGKVIYPYFRMPFPQEDLWNRGLLR